jgi:hypothetical protein
MKIMGKILIIYIFTLLAFPCQDSFGFSCPQHNEQSTDQDGCPIDCHTCSPFCTCNCCHTNTVVALESNLISVEFIPFSYISLYKDEYFQEITLAIWQPPKIS